MKRSGKTSRKSRCLCLCLGFSLASILASTFCADIARPAFAANGKALKGTVFQNELIDKLETLGIKCAVQPGAGDLKSIESVRAGSKAFYGGAACGDSILGTRTVGDIFFMKIQRQGKVYEIPFKGIPLAPTTNPTQTVPEVTISPKSQPVPELPLVADEKTRREKLLVKYDIDLIIDTSGSMNFVDGTGGKTKFEWCHDQVRDLATRLAPYKKNLDITTFNYDFNTEQNCNPERIEQIYASTKPAGGTNLLVPLTARMDHTAETRGLGHKALIAVITDGEPNIPNDPQVIDRAIVEFTKTLNHPDEVVIAFFQIGDTFDGGAFCQNLDEHLLVEGARFDIVTTQKFASLKQRGLTNALIQSIVDNRVEQSANEATAAGASNNQKDPTAERRRIEKQLGL